MRRPLVSLIAVLITVMLLVRPEVATATPIGQLGDAPTAVADSRESPPRTTSRIPADAFKVCVRRGVCRWVAQVRRYGSPVYTRYRPGYCPPTYWCGKRAFVPWTGGYCSASVGCMSWRGRNYKVNIYPRADPARERAALRCLLGLGLSVATLVTRGPSRLGVAGLGLTAWGCSELG